MSASNFIVLHPIIVETIQNNKNTNLEQNHAIAKINFVAYKYSYDISW